MANKEKVDQNTFKENINDSDRKIMYCHICTFGLIIMVAHNDIDFGSRYGAFPLPVPTV